MCSVQCAVCSVQCAVYSVQCAVCSVQCAVCSTLMDCLASAVSRGAISQLLYILRRHLDRGGKCQHVGSIISVIISVIGSIIQGELLNWTPLTS